MARGDIKDRLFSGLSDLLEQEMFGLDAKLFDLCESPIERALGAAIILSAQVIGDKVVLSSQNPEELEVYGPEVTVIVPQYQWENYRVDFAIRSNPHWVFVECDGHDFHERTKEQAARDRKRDREMQSSGFRVLRFTGSEIFRDPCGCAQQVFECIGNLHMHDYIASSRGQEGR